MIQNHLPTAELQAIDAAQERKINVKLFTLLGPSSLELLDQLRLLVGHH